MTTPAHIQQKIKSVIQLPALPAIAMEIVDRVDNPKTSAANLSKLISSDQALAGKVLKIANSPFYGFPRKISTVSFAIIVLGFDALKEIVISISLMSSLQKESDTIFDADAFWDHSILSGLVGRRLARDLGYRVSEEVFVGALLHDMGVTILHRYFLPEFKRIVGMTQETELTYLEAEESVLGVTHAAMGGWLAERWNLPEHLMEAIAWHHAPGQATKNKELAALIHCADVIANLLVEQPNEHDRGVVFDAGALKLLGLEEEGTLADLLGSYRAAVEGDFAQVTSQLKRGRR
jgi:HD-like signal output (HDOD) protein